MTEYRVTWAIDVDANYPAEAARKARAIQLDPTSIATFFTVVGPSRHRPSLSTTTEIELPPGEP